MDKWNTVLEQTIAAMAGGHHKVATPTISSLSKEEETRSWNSNTIPIGAKHEDALIPSNYNAYGGEALNF